MTLKERKKELKEEKKSKKIKTLKKIKENTREKKKIDRKELTKDLKIYINYEDYFCDTDEEKVKNLKKLIDPLLNDIEFGSGNVKKKVEELINVLTMNGLDSVSFSKFSEFVGWEKTRGEKEKEKINSKFVLTDEECPELINHALGFIHQKTLDGKKRLRYYGVYLKEKIKTKDGESRRETPALILESGDIISCKNPNLDKYFFELETKMSLKRNRWSLDSINNFINNSNQQITFKEVFLEYKNFYNENMVFEYEGYYILNPVWDMLTYFQDVLDKFLFIKHEGVSDSAKSKGMKISANLSFNGRKWLCPNPANFFRYRHHNKSVIYIEEAEKLFADKNKNKDDSELVEYLNGSYERGNYVPRQSEKDRDITEEFDPAGFTRLGAISPLKGALLKRVIVQTMIKAPKNDLRSNTEIPTEQNRKFVTARDKMYICALKNYKLFEDSLKTVKNPYGFLNRIWLQVKPLLAIANCIDLKLPNKDKIENRLGEFIYKLYTTRDDDYSSDSWEVKLGKALLVFFEAGFKLETEEFIDNDRLKVMFEEQFDTHTETIPNISSGGISRVIGKMGFSDFRSKDSKGNKRGYKLSYKKVKEILDRNSIIFDDSKSLSEENNDNPKTPKSLSEVSDCPKTSNLSLKSNNFGNNSSDKLRTINKSNVSEASDKRTTDKYFEGCVETVYSNTKKDLFKFIKKNPKNNAEDVEKNFDIDFVKKVLRNGDIVELPKGTYKIL